jgi:hypothetical protein
VRAVVFYSREANFRRHESQGKFDVFTTYVREPFGGESKTYVEANVSKLRARQGPLQNALFWLREHIIAVLVL